MSLKILFASHAGLFPPEHGGAKNVRHLSALLANDGHKVRVLVKLHPASSVRIRFQGQYFQGLKDGKTVAPLLDSGVEYRFVAGASEDLAKATEVEIANFKPDCVAIGDDSLDEGTALYDVASRSKRLVFVAQTVHSLSFGPFAMKPSLAITKAIRRSRKIIAPSEHVAKYIRDYLLSERDKLDGSAAAALKPEVSVFYPNVFGSGPYPRLGHPTNPFITMINPCPWKGSSILINLARSRPDLQFAAVPTWGATPDFLVTLAQISNLTLLEESENIDSIFSKTRILIVPSLCQEAFGLVSPEALLRGVPVIASNIAGLKESTLGCARLIDVDPLPFHKKQISEDLMKLTWAEPTNSVQPWSAAIDEILSSDTGYARVAEAGRLAAQDFVQGLNRRSVSTVFKIE